MRDAAPDAVWHLAAQASVGRSWEAPAETIAENVTMTANLLEAVRLEAPGATVVLISSGEIYGPPDRLPVDEDAPLRPQNPYAVSKAAVRPARRPVRRRAPGCAWCACVPSTTPAPARATTTWSARSPARWPRPRRPGWPRRSCAPATPTPRATSPTCATSCARTWPRRGSDPGVYNVASGRAVSVRELIELVRAAARIPVRHEIDPARVRAHDVPEVRGSAERLREATGWTPEIPLEQTVADALEAWRAALGAAR